MCETAQCLAHNKYSNLLAVVIKDIIRKAKHFISSSKQSKVSFLLAPEISSVILMVGIQKSVILVSFGVS